MLIKVVSLRVWLGRTLPEALNHVWVNERAGVDVSWLKEKLFGPKKSQDKDLAEKLYQVLVANGGPSISVDSHIDATSLEISIGKLEGFTRKRLISLEEFIFVAAQIGTVERSKKLQGVFGDDMLHPFVVEMGELIGRKWRERGIEIEDSDVGKHCFDDVEDFLENPFRWGRMWLDEFSDDSEQSGEHYISWADLMAQRIRNHADDGHAVYLNAALDGMLNVGQTSFKRSVLGSWPTIGNSIGQ